MKFAPARMRRFSPECLTDLHAPFGTPAFT